jgi:hypothetical protein
MKAIFFPCELLIYLSIEILTILTLFSSTLLLLHSTLYILVLVYQPHLRHYPEDSFDDH